MTMRVVLNGSLLEQFARASVDNVRDSRSIQDAATELAVNSERQKSLEQDRQNQIALTQAGFQMVMKGAEIGLKAKSAVETTQRVTGEMRAHDQLQTNAQAAQVDPATATTGTQGASGTRDAASFDRLMDTQLTDQGTRVRDRFSEPQIRTLMSPRSTPHTDASLRAGGFDDDTLRAQGHISGRTPAEVAQQGTAFRASILKVQDGHNGLTTDQAVEFVFAHRNAEVDVQAGLAKQRENAVLSAFQSIPKDIGNETFRGATDRSKRIQEQAGDGKERARGMRAGIMADRQQDLAQLQGVTDAVRRDRAG